MPQAVLTLEEITLAAPAQMGGVLHCPPGMLPAAGQYWLAHAPTLDEPLPTILFPSRILADAVHIAPPLPAAWSAGTQLSLRGPLGKGFQLPGAVRSVALAALDELPHRLLPLVDTALRQGAAVALYTNALPRNLPGEVEILPLDLLPEACAWADYLAVDVPAQRVAELPRLLNLQPHQTIACAAQALVFTAMPCGGLAECGVCAVAYRRGYRLACKEGPVFNLAPLLEGLSRSMLG